LYFEIILPFPLKTETPMLFHWCRSPLDTSRPIGLRDMYMVDRKQCDIVMYEISVSFPVHGGVSQMLRPLTVDSVWTCPVSRPAVLYRPSYTVVYLQSRVLVNGGLTVLWWASTSCCPCLLHGEWWQRQRTMVDERWRITTTQSTLACTVTRAAVRGR